MYTKTILITLIVCCAYLTYGEPIGKHNATDLQTDKPDDNLPPISDEPIGKPIAANLKVDKADSSMELPPLLWDDDYDESLERPRRNIGIMSRWLSFLGSMYDYGAFDYTAFDEEGRPTLALSG